MNDERHAHPDHHDLAHERISIQGGETRFIGPSESAGHMLSPRTGDPAEPAVSRRQQKHYEVHLRLGYPKPDHGAKLKPLGTRRFPECFPLP